MSIKKICAVVAAVLVFAGYSGTGTELQAATAGAYVVTPETAQEQPFEATMPTAEKLSDTEDVSAIFTQNLKLPKGAESKAFFKFELAEDSWVYFSGNYSLNNHDGLGTKVKVYGDSAYSKLKVEYGWGYWNYEKYAAAVLKAGTYYVHVFNKHENFSHYEGNVNVVAVAIPVEKAIAVEQVLSGKKDKVTVSVTSGIGTETKLVEYRQGKLGEDSIGNSTYWGKLLSGEYYNSYDDKTVQLKLNDENAYVFEVKNNGYFTLLLSDNKNGHIIKNVKVSGIDDVKPSITGVKNNKTYKVSVTVKFSDKGSGIKSATLNGSKIKSGTKITAKGKYKLVVKDKAGNENSISFTVK